MKPPRHFSILYGAATTHAMVGHMGRTLCGRPFAGRSKSGFTAEQVLELADCKVCRSCIRITPESAHGGAPK